MKAATASTDRMWSNSGARPVRSSWSLTWPGALLVSAMMVHSASRSRRKPGSTSGYGSIELKAPATRSHASSGAVRSRLEYTLSSAAGASCEKSTYVSVAVTVIESCNSFWNQTVKPNGSSRSSTTVSRTGARSSVVSLMSNTAMRAVMSGRYVTGRRPDAVDR